MSQFEIPIFILDTQKVSTEKTTTHLGKIEGLLAQILAYFKIVSLCSFFLA